MAIVVLKKENLASFVEFRHQASLESEWINDLTLARAREKLEKIDSDVNQQAYLAMMGGEVVGQLFVVYYPDRETLKISLISTLLKTTGYGIGQSLMDKALKIANVFRAKKVELVVSSQNTKAIAFYNRYGFQLEGKKTTGNLKLVKVV